MKKAYPPPGENGPNMASGGCDAKDMVIWEVPSLTPDGNTPLGHLFSTFSYLIIVFQGEYFSLLLL